VGLINKPTFFSPKPLLLPLKIHIVENIELIEKIKEVIDPYLDENGIELIDMTYRREQGGMTLRLLVDTPGGIRVDECESVNNYLGELLDDGDLIGERYVIEVCSPGLDRPITTDRDFERSIGKELDVTTFGPINGCRAHEGCLIGIDVENIVLETDGTSTIIPRDKIAMARLKIKF
jgi:ribosome maturation factor RimP